MYNGLCTITAMRWDALLLILPVTALAQRLIWLETLPECQSKALSISADGSRVVGTLMSPDQRRIAFFWHNATGHFFNELGLRQGAARGISADGRTIVGWIYGDDGYPIAFRLRETSADMLGTPGTAGSVATAVSADGSVVVGWFSQGNLNRAFRWTEEAGILELGTLGGAESLAFGVSGDGAVVVGRAHDERGEWRAFRWVAGEMQDLGDFGGTRAEALGVSADGRVVIGWAEHPSGFMEAFRWEEADGMIALGTLGGAQSKALAVSADGSIVVGWSDTPEGKRRAFRWSRARGMEDLTTVYAALLSDSSELLEARAITPDGRFIAGWGYNATRKQITAYLLDTQDGNTVPDAARPTLALRIEPHPVLGSAQVRYTLPDAAAIRLEISDLLGRQRVVLADGWEPAGERVHKLPDLGAGFYICRLQYRQRVDTAPVIVLR